MKRFFVTFVVILSLFFLVGCNRISIYSDENAVLKFQGKMLGDNTELTQILTREETTIAREYLSSAEYTPGQGGCPFDKDISISFGDQIFAIGYDDCPSVYWINSDKCYTVSTEGRNYIVSLFEKYVGYFPFPKT